jgi:hypothetical protein
MRFSCSPCAASARRIALAKSLAEPNDVTPVSMRPGSRVVISCKQPTIAVGITEGGERSVSTVFRIWTAKETVRSEVEYLTHFDAGGIDRIPGGFYVRDDEVSSLY